MCLMREAIKVGYGTQVKTFCGADQADAVIGSQRMRVRKQMLSRACSGLKYSTGGALSAI